MKCYRCGGLMVRDAWDYDLVTCLQCARSVDLTFRQPLALPDQTKRNYEPREGRRPKTQGVRL